jgi:tetratricopeptide (TPR) repeat protein
LAKAEEKIVALQKEKDLLIVALEQAKAAKPSTTTSPESDKTAAQLADANQALANLKARSLEDAKSAQAELAQLKGSLADAQKKITSDSVEIDALKAARASEASVGAVTAERDKLKEDLAARTRDLADAEARRDQNMVELRTKEADVERQRDELRTKLADAERQRDELQTKSAAAPVAAPVAPPATTDAQVDQLRARLAVLEAPAVPYTPEELAVFKKNPPQPLAQMPVAPAETKHIIHSKKDLPPGTGALMEDATRAKMQRDYPRAAEIYQDILRQDMNNVYVLANLAFVQFSMNKIADCEKTVLRTLALDPEDPASLNLLGIMRYRQEKLDEALSALSLSAKYNSTNASTQYYLGCVLTEKGLRPGAETAFRKALEADPNYADAHYGLAFVYAQEKPPSLALARWHYQRALDLGHSKSPELEKLLASAP